VKSRLLAYSVALLLGVVLNVTVAWVCAARGGLPRQHESDLEPDRWPRPVPASWPDRPGVRTRLWHGAVGTTHVYSSERVAYEDSWRPEGATYDIVAVAQRLRRFGIPFRSMEVEERNEIPGYWSRVLPEGTMTPDMDDPGVTVHRVMSPELFEQRDAVFVATGWHTPPPRVVVGPEIHLPIALIADAGRRDRMRAGTVAPAVLPLRPLPPGFVANTVLYAVVIFLVADRTRWCVRWRRRVRGLCPWCRYPSHDAPVCTECGRGPEKT
jgi:hypothetical protein